MSSTVPHSVVHARSYVDEVEPAPKADSKPDSKPDGKSEGKSGMVSRVMS